MQRWQEHFSKILNSGVDNQIVENRMADNQIIVKEEGNEEYVKYSRINIKAPTVIEIKQALKELKRVKQQKLITYRQKY